MANTNRETPVESQQWTEIEDNYVGLRDDTKFRQSPTRESTLINRKPVNEYQALMEALPGHAPESIQDENLPMREAVADCIELLSEQDVFILDAIHAERLSVAELAERLGISSKGHMHRLIKEAQERLRVVMLQNPTIMERING